MIRINTKDITELETTVYTVYTDSSTDVKQTVHRLSAGWKWWQTSSNIVSINVCDTKLILCYKFRQVLPLVYYTDDKFHGNTCKNIAF